MEAVDRRGEKTVRRGSEASESATHEGASRLQVQTSEKTQITAQESGSLSIPSAVFTNF